MRYPLLIILLLSTAGLSATSLGADLDAYKTIYAKERSAIDTAFSDAIKQAPTVYMTELGTLASSRQESGDLDGYLRARDEKTRFMSARKVSTAPHTDPTINTMQTRFRETGSSASTQKSLRLKALSDRYLLRLDALKRALTAKNKIAEAVAADKEYKTVNTDPEVIAARKASAALAPAPTKMAAAEAKPNSHDPQETCPGVKIYASTERPPKATSFTSKPGVTSGLAPSSPLSARIGLRSEKKNGGLNEHVRITLRPTLRQALGDACIVVQYYDVGEVVQQKSGFSGGSSRLRRLNNSSKKVVEPELRTTHHIYGVTIPAKGLTIDCPALTGSDRLYGMILSVYDSKETLIMQTVTPAALRAEAKAKLLQ